MKHDNRGGVVLSRDTLVWALGAAALLTTSCLAPMCRTTEIPRGFALAVEPGATVFKSTGFVPDTARLFRNRSVPLTCVGAQADLRAGYGLTDWLGADLTAGPAHLEW